MAVTQYIGARYVPITADPIEWSNANAYEPLTIVMHQGNSYTSRQYVPVGIDIANDGYWALTGNYNAQVEQYRQEVRAFDGRITANTTAITAETAARETADNDITALVNANAAAITAETAARETADSDITALVNANTAAITAETAARETLQGLIIKNVKDYGALGNGIANDSPAINAAIAGGGLVYFPEGTYRLFSAINLESNLKLIGYGAHLHVDRDVYDATTQYSGIGFTANDSSQTLHDCVVEGFEITGNTEFASNAITIRQNRTIPNTVINRVFIRNCHIHNMGNRGVNCGGASAGDSPYGHGTPDVTVEGCMIHDCGGYTICNSGTSMKVRNCRVYNSGLECITVDNGCYRVFIENSVFNNARSGAGCISIDEGSSIFINNCMFEQSNNDRPAFRVNCATGNVNNLFVSNCMFAGGTYALSIGSETHYTHMSMTNCEGTTPSIGSLLSRNDEDWIFTSGNNWFRTMTEAQKTALASKLKTSATSNTII